MIFGHGWQVGHHGEEQARLRRATIPFGRSSKKVEADFPDLSERTVPMTHEARSLLDILTNAHLRSPSKEMDKLRQLGDRRDEFVSVALGSLSDRNEVVRRNAALVLGEMGDPKEIVVSALHRGTRRQGRAGPGARPLPWESSVTPLKPQFRS